ncbi:response regulator transcription factor [Aliarcobacter cryaerophilus]|uniref:response regulator transcription factor n=1 Tax=Aliarcobacter cryaerophilus TaxID=28198 RepID=UPI003DA5DD6F
MNILLIEDDLTLNELITDYLKLNGNSVVSLEDGMNAIDTINKTNFDLYIIDINIPHINGLEIVKYIRQKDISTPIIMITASMELENFKTAYKNGCDDYIKKPFYLEELEIRIDKLLSKKSNGNSLIKISDTITYDTEYEELSVRGEVKRLRKKERLLLNILLKNVNKLVTNEIIENYVWENEIKELYPLRQLVNDLRKHFDNGEKFIFAERGMGYKFEIKN